MSNRPAKSALPNTSGNEKAIKRRPKLEVLSSRVVFKGRVFDVNRDKVREPNGVTAVREVIQHSGSVVILALDDSAAEPRVLIERQYRYAARDFMLELPAGRIDPGENVVVAGKRELREETGYAARKWKPVLYFYPSPGFLAETMTILLATGLKAGTAEPEADERIEHRLVPLSRVVRLISAGQIRDGKTIAGVLWCWHHLKDRPSS
jgi:ADP-ribose pyrophosphatase